MLTDSLITDPIPEIRLWDSWGAELRMVAEVARWGVTALPWGLGGTAIWPWWPWWSCPLSWQRWLLLSWGQLEVPGEPGGSCCWSYREYLADWGIFWRRNAGHRLEGRSSAGPAPCWLSSECWPSWGQQAEGSDLCFNETWILNLKSETVNTRSTLLFHSRVYCVDCFDFYSFSCSVQKCTLFLIILFTNLITTNWIQKVDHHYGLRYQNSKDDRTRSKSFQC